MEMKRAVEAPGAGVQETVSRPYLAYVLVILLLINIFNFIDRQIPFILAESIKRDLGLSDTQIGLFGGLAFSLIYPFLGLPLARMADKYGRKWVLSGCLFFWSLLTACGGLAANFTQLMLSRLGVSAGEAGSTPSGHALIAAYFPLEKRSVPLAIFGLGVPLGSMLALVLGGWINDVASWRQALFWLGVPGVILALVTLFTVREPGRGSAAAVAPDVPMLETIRMLGRQSAFRQMAAGIAIYSMGANAMIVFTPAFLMRSHGLSATQTGLSLGLLYGVAGVAGTMVGGWLGDVLGRRDPRWRLWTTAIGLALAAPCTAAAWLVPQTAATIGLLAAPKFANLLYVGPIYAVLQSLAPANARASASAVLLFFNSLVGLTLGPPLVGFLSDVLRATYGDQALRYALCLVPLTQVWAALHFFAAARALRREAALREPDAARATA